MGSSKGSGWPGLSQAAWARPNELRSPRVDTRDRPESPFALPLAAPVGPHRRGADRDGSRARAPFLRGEPGAKSARSAGARHGAGAPRSCRPRTPDHAPGLLGPVADRLRRRAEPRAPRDPAGPDRRRPLPQPRQRALPPEAAGLRGRRPPRLLRRPELREAEPAAPPRRASRRPRPRAAARTALRPGGSRGCILRGPRARAAARRGRAASGDAADRRLSLRRPRERHHRPRRTAQGVGVRPARRDHRMALARGRALPPSPEPLAQALRERRVALVNAHYSVALAQASAAAGIPFVQTVHSPYFWLDDLERERWQRADGLTAAYACVSAIVACFADLNLGLSPSKMVVFPNGCHAATAPLSTSEEDSRLRAELGIGADAAVFVNVGSLYPVKGQHLLLEAFAEIAPECPHSHLVFVGGQLNEDYAKQLRELVAAHGLESRVRFTGRRDDVHRFLDLATALVMPSLSEGWSLAISEALRRGTPVVSTEVGAAVEQLRGPPGRLLPAAFEDWRTLRLTDFDLALRGASDAPRLWQVRRALADAMRELAAEARLPHRPT
ncbi:MAG TPA: hypothetical protein DFS52_15855, partial [Myxococcales bacterium]|nr:hypothetical protein [Myxococcales bacterium]